MKTDRICLSCGSPFLARSSPSDIASGRGKYCSKSCASQNSNRRHGRSFGPSRIGSRTLDPTYLTWQGMVARCSNPNLKGWKWYGGRGIRVCDRWRDFNNFLSDMGDRPKGASLDRIDFDGDYEPSNCRWASAREQAQNRKDAIWLEIDGERIAAADLERRLDFPRGTIANRLRHGISEGDILKPLRYRKHQASDR